MERIPADPEQEEAKMPKRGAKDVDQGEQLVEQNYEWRDDDVEDIEGCRDIVHHGMPSGIIPIHERVEIGESLSLALSKNAERVEVL